MLQRHRLAWLADSGWTQARGAPWDAQARACIDHWHAHRLPWVVTRQRSTERLALGLAAPMQFGRRRLAIEVEPSAVLRYAAFPAAENAARLLDIDARPAWPALCAGLRGVGCKALVYGSHGWQLLCGLVCVHAASDIDLLLPVESDAMADAVCERLAAAPLLRSRIDGELLFPDGAGVAWREWVQWRSGGTRQLLVKRMHGAALEACSPAAELASC